MPAPKKKSRTKEAFTLPEVMITMFLISMMCLSVFAGLQQVTKSMMSVALRSEAYRHLQAEAERLLSVDYVSFGASSDVALTSAVKTSYAPSTAAALTVPSDNSAGRTTFTQRVIEVSSTATSRTLRVEVEWTWEGRTHVIATPLHRNQ